MIRLLRVLCVLCLPWVVIIRLTWALREADGCILHKHRALVKIRQQCVINRKECEEMSGAKRRTLNELQALQTRYDQDMRKWETSMSNTQAILKRRETRAYNAGFDAGYLDAMKGANEHE